MLAARIDQPLKMASAPTSTYFFRMVRLLHFLGRFNGFACVTYRYGKQLKIEVKWFDVILLFIFLVIHITFALLNSMVPLKFAHFKSDIFLWGMNVMNSLSMVSVIVITIFNFVSRERLGKIINEIGAIDQVVSNTSNTVKLKIVFLF